MGAIAEKRHTQKLDIEEIRKDFPALNMTVRGKPLIYLDNAATTHKPRQVLDAVMNFYEQQNANIHRGVHYLSEIATDAYEAARDTVRQFINARSTREIIFVRGTTEAINLVASSFGRKNIREGDEILISAMEHHSNIVPWQLLCEATGAKLRIIPINDHGEIIREQFENAFTPRTRLLSVVHVSNSLGTENPVKEMIRFSHENGVPVLLDGAQGISHNQLDVQELDCDFYAFSGHKIYGPTGIGVLYGKEALLDAMPPYQGGGDMIRSVTFEKTLYNELPHKFEAGTPNIAGAIGLGKALEYVSSVGMENILLQEQELLNYVTELISEINGIRIIGTARKKAAVISFVFDDIHPHDVGTILDQQGIAIRTGHHCTQPVMERFNVPATSRASLAFYNRKEELDKLAEGIYQVIKIFKS